MKRLTGYVTVTNPDTGVEWSGGPESDPPDWARKLITNPSAWADLSPDEMDQDDLLRVRDYTRVQLVVAAERLGVVVPDTAGKDAIAAVIKRELFKTENPDAELTGDDPFTLENDTRGGASTAPKDDGQKTPPAPPKK